VRTRLLGLVVAVATTVSVGWGAAAPAQAAETRPATQHSVVRPAVDPATVIAIVKGAYDIYKSFVAGGASAAAATSQILAAINSAKIEILAHIDAIATAQARACAEEVVIDFDSFDALTPDNKQGFALSTTSCLTTINSLQGAVTDKAAQDQLGFALDSVGPIALIVRSRTGLSNSGLVTVLVSGNRTSQSVMAPSCHSFIQEGRSQWECSSYNGDSGGAEPSLALAQREAGRRTSWALANAVLPTLLTL
jgi:hypothetical protein